MPHVIFFLTLLKTYLSGGYQLYPYEQSPLLFIPSSFDFKYLKKFYIPSLHLHFSVVNC